MMKEELIDFMAFLILEGQLDIDPDQMNRYAEIWVSSNSKPNEGDRVVNENEPQKEVYSCPTCPAKFIDLKKYQIHRFGCGFQE